MKETIYQLQSKIVDRKKAWEDAKNPKHPTSIFICNRRIQQLNQALQLIAEVELIDDSTKRK